ncbi:MAG TPA: RluA family pseudouridine synthase [Tepidisphaeraceae bacterium]|nr:RluA family pseudouridine synthase [Tepidisphaeraceae bacterium]
MAKDRTIHIDERGAGQTLAAFLRAVMKESSWNEIKKLIAQRHVQIDGNLCLDDSRRLKGGEVVKIYAIQRAPVPSASSVRIVHRDPHLVIVDKPAGMTTLRHEQEKNWSARRKQIQPTLEESLESLLMPPKTRRSSRERSPIQIRPVHRLDRDTSGLMVFALTPQTERDLIALFKAHDIDREYRAVVHGHPKKQTIETWIARDRGDGLRGSVEKGSREDAQQAITHVEPIQQLGPYSIILCRLETGRTHQIRIHLSELGHMLCGEKIYTHRLGEKPKRDTSQAPRQSLHAAVIGFVHPNSGKSIRFESGWPDEIESWLTTLQKI